MMRAVALLILLCLTACGGPVKRVNPPGASIQRLVVNADQSYTLDLRLQNHSDLSTRFARLTGKLSLAGIDAGPLDAALDIDVPAHAAEIVAVRLAPPPGSVSALAGSLGRDARAAVRYRLDGEVTTTEPRGRYEVEFESALTPVPGVPGEYR